MEILEERGIDAKGFIALHPGAGEREKIWSPDHYGALVDLIEQAFSLPSVILFTDKERHLFDAIVGMTSAQPVGISVSFDILAAIIEKSRAFIGSDSAPHHAACALGIPSIVLMPRDRTATWHPYDVQRHRFLIGGEGLDQEGALTGLLRGRSWRNYGSLLRWFQQDRFCTCDG
jgi:ADP-heptose:LPS heptosyltransferase